MHAMHAESQEERPEDNRKNRQERERDLARLAERQHGVVARSQLAERGLGRGAIANRLKLRQLCLLHRGVYAVGQHRLSQHGRWMAAVLSCGEGAVLSHRSAAALWGLMRPRSTPVDVTSQHGRQGRKGIVLHKAQIRPPERTARAGIPVTSLPRTLLDLAEVVDEQRLSRAFEEADRLGRLQMRGLEQVCARAGNRRGLAGLRRLMDAAREPVTTRSPLEDRFAAFCDAQGLPRPAFNTTVLGRETDVFWPHHRLVVELDGFAYHRHRAAFERDRARDAALQAAGYRVMRITHRRLDSEGAGIAIQLRKMLGVE
jgi:hypothetical protein